MKNFQKKIAKKGKEGKGREEKEKTKEMKCHFFFPPPWECWGLNFRASGTLLLEPHLQSIFLWLFWRYGLKNYLPGLASNLHPPNLSFPSS
jgi:hypothetical protein